MPATKRAREEDAVNVDADAKQQPKPKPAEKKQSTLPFGSPKKAAAPAAAAPEAPAGDVTIKEGPLKLSCRLTDPGWRAILKKEMEGANFAAIESTLAKEQAAKKQVFPPLEMVFAAFNETPLQKVSVVIIGQDPYHDDNQAHGMCFSVLPGIKPPPSLKNMYTELEADVPGFKAPTHGYLMSWAQQGVLLINASLTVEAHKANSHSAIGWQAFTDTVITQLSDTRSGIVFLLWGGFAKKKGKKIDRKKHIVIECAHPSPLSVTAWRGCKTFSKCNEALKKLGKPEIDWRLPATVTAA